MTESELQYKLKQLQLLPAENEIVEFKEASRIQIESLLWDKLSDVLNENSKRHKVKNLVQSLRKNNKIELNPGKKWVLKS